MAMVYSATINHGSHLLCLSIPFSAAFTKLLKNKFVKQQWGTSGHAAVGDYSS